MAPLHPNCPLPSITNSTETRDSVEVAQDHQLLLHGKICGLQSIKTIARTHTHTLAPFNAPPMNQVSIRGTKGRKLWELPLASGKNGCRQRGLAPRGVVQKPNGGPGASSGFTESIPWSTELGAWPRHSELFAVAVVSPYPCGLHSQALHRQWESPCSYHLVLCIV